MRQPALMPVVVRASAGLALALAACSTPCAADGAQWQLATTTRPDGCRRVAAGADLQAAVDGVAAGGALCLEAGHHRGPIAVRTAMTIWGPRDAVIDSGGAGTVVRLAAPGARLLGVTVDGAGGRFDKLDGAVLVTGDDAVVEGITVVGAVYGVLVERAWRVRIAGNHVRGGTEAAIGQRGDTVRLWETDDAVVEDNLLEDGRDMVVWYSRNATVRRNQVRRARYGTHFMFGHGARVIGNRYVDVTVGVFVMYSRGVELSSNLIANAAGAAGIAIGLKDSGSVRIIDNVLVRDEVGIYLDATPQRRDEQVEIRGNQLRLCRTAIAFHAAGHGVVVRGNDFGGNEIQTRVDGGGDALSVTWEGNWFDDYTGYDLDDDGIGDVPYELRSFSGQLMARRPELGFFQGTPALAMADAAAHLDPLFQPHKLLVDPRPRMAPVATRGGI